MRVEDAHWLRSQAQRCRLLSSSTIDERVAATLKLMAQEYEARAREMDAQLWAEPVPEPRPEPEAGPPGGFTGAGGLP